ncbi:PP2C family protein-serine/threonine phosphatase [Agromyces marinus]|uniref:PP2C family protein-serine/threonine phosphatase n=1 Tax=Agromyces marinus TaxID=1389020 RepID=UPI001F24B3CD|nr:protein phosphatase 2C domain-containing protein [Agromyces marinus]UIP58939.1 Serine/threonine phosphatase stp [Agromyces marinus]
MTSDVGGVVPIPSGSARIAHSARTHVGNVRAVNEDSVLAQPPIYLVADGMGGHARGDAASRAVVDTFRRHLDAGVPSTPAQVLDAIHSSNDVVRALSEEGDEGTAVAGTTLAGLVLVDAGDGRGIHWMVFNVGDSRVYAWDGRRLDQVTVDHSAVQEMVDAGVLRAEDAERHPDRNVITRAIGADEHVEPDVWLVPAVGRQVFLVCSDGLSKEVPDDEIARVLAGGSTHDAGLAGDLVDAALAAGARDNVSAVVVESDLGGEADDDGTTRDRDGELVAGVEETRPRKGESGAGLPA